MIYLNNKLVPESRAMISVFDHGFLYGDGIYESLRAYNGTVFKLDEHIDRLFRSASFIRLKIPKTAEEIKKAVCRTMRASRLRNAFIRISVSRGAGPIGLDPALCPKPAFVIIPRAFKEYTKKYYENGVSIAVVNVRRNYAGALDPQMKSHNFLNNILAKIEAKDRGAFEAIMLNYRGYIAEGTIANIFFIKNSILCTPSPDVGILNGITRRVIMDAAKGLKIKTKEGKFTRKHLYGADEVFISNTSMEVMPVTAVDNIRIGKKAGNITRMLGMAYKEKVSEYLKNNKCRI
ncbi:MAG: branched-chain-amino-acid transaminase [Nitrospirae bacterium]|nr:branched-chain-amino-acid transaminase [Nitrospirota bacterium]